MQNRLTGLARRWADVNELLSVRWRLRELEAALRRGASAAAEMRPLVEEDV